MSVPVIDSALPPTYWLDNVLVEAAIVDTDEGATTQTRRAAVRVDGGEFAEIRVDVPAPGDGSLVVDADGLLILPALRDTHVHLDKTFYGGPWRAPIPGRHWLAEEVRLLPEMSGDIPVRSNAILDLLVSHGTARVVAHCNVDHVVGTRNVERVGEVVRHRNDVTVEVVAYPQHGLQNGRIVPLLAQALDAGATVIGGLDPALVEGDIEKTLDTIFGLAVAHDVGIDLHLHDAGTLGLFELDRVIARTVEAGWQGRVHLEQRGCLGKRRPANCVGAGRPPGGEPDRRQHHDECRRIRHPGSAALRRRCRRLARQRQHHRHPDPVRAG